MQETLFQMPDKPEKRQSGRPKIKISVEKQALIKAALRGGMSFDDLGAVLDIDPKTIRKYFSTFRVQPIDDVADAACKRLRKMGSELHRISEELAAFSATRDQG